MVASSKLHHAQNVIVKMRPYQQKLNEILQGFLANLGDEFATSLAQQRTLSRVAIVVLSSDTSLCGGFNTTVIKALKKRIDYYVDQGVVVSVFPIGKKVAEATKRMGYDFDENIAHLLHNPSYVAIEQLANHLISLFESQQIDAVDLIYQHFQSAGVQVLHEEAFLPLSLSPKLPPTSDEQDTFYLIEPSVEEIMTDLLPKSLQMHLYATVLDSLAAEHAARVIAMQIATDNADELLKQLTLQYNKTRQQAITAELLDIVGGSMQ